MRDGPRIFWLPPTFPASLLWGPGRVWGLGLKRGFERAPLHRLEVSFFSFFRLCGCCEQLLPLFALSPPPALSRSFALSRCVFGAPFLFDSADTSSFYFFFLFFVTNRNYTSAMNHQLFFSFFFFFGFVWPHDLPIFFSLSLFLRFFLRLFSPSFFLNFLASIWPRSHLLLFFLCLFFLSLLLKNDSWKELDQEEATQKIRSWRH
jgi:hypothetical protein